MKLRFSSLRKINAASTKLRPLRSELTALSPTTFRDNTTPSQRDHRVSNNEHTELDLSLPSMSSRQEELLAKKARLAELKRQRELRQEQLSSKRQSIGGEVSTAQHGVELALICTGPFTRSYDRGAAERNRQPGVESY